MKIIEKSGYQALPWVRYITQSGGALGPPPKTPWTPQVRPTPFLTASLPADYQLRTA